MGRLVPALVLAAGLVAAGVRADHGRLEWHSPVASIFDKIAVALDRARR